MFERIYSRLLRYSRHRHAACYLVALSFAESSFFPIPPDVMLIPMALARPKQAWRLAGLATLASVSGGMLGYGIGYFALVSVEPWLHQWGYWEGYRTARHWFEQWGFWAVFVAGFSPVPYKVFTIAAGSMVMNPLAFIVVSFVGRGARFFLVASLIAWGGERLEQAVYRHINRIGWASLGLVGGVGLLYVLLR